MKNQLKYLLLILPYLFASCASTEPPRSSDPTPEELAESAGYASIEPIKEVLNYRLNGFHSINRQALIINSSGRQAYLVTLMRHCEGLTSTDTIGTTSTLSKLTTFDSIIVPSTFRGREQCPISEIFKLKDKLEKRPQEKQPKAG